MTATHNNPRRSKRLVIALVILGALCVILFQAAVPRRFSVAAPRMNTIRENVLTQPPTTIDKHDVVPSDPGTTLTKEPENVEEDKDQIKKNVLETLRQHVPTLEMLQRSQKYERGDLKACFLTLTRHSSSGLTRLHRLFKNVEAMLPLMAKKYPFVVFHEDSADSDKLLKKLVEKENEFRKKSPDAPFATEKKIFLEKMQKERYVFFAGILLTALSDDDFGNVPKYVNSEQRKSWPYPSSSYWGVAYRHMCRFFAVRIFYQKILENFNYYLRLDTDSFLLAQPLSASWVLHKPAETCIQNSSSVDLTKPVPVDLDLFREVYVRRAYYGFLMIHPQTQPIFMTKLWESYDEFVREEKREHGENYKSSVYKHPELPHGKFEEASSLTETAPRGVGLHYWDNFEIMDLRFLRDVEPKEVETLVEARRKDFEHELTAVSQALYPSTGAGEDGANGVTGQSSAASTFHEAYQQFLEEDEKIYRERIANHNVRGDTGLRFLNFMDRKGGFYYYRWGDAEVRTMLVSMLVPRSKVLYFDSLSYQHYHNYHCPEIGTKKDRKRERQVVNQRIFSTPDIQRLQLAEGIALAMNHPQQSVELTMLLSCRNNSIEMLTSAIVEERTAAAKKCKAEAQSNYGTGSKGLGTAAMCPAEAKHINTAFWKMAVSQDGWLPV